VALAGVILGGVLDYGSFRRVMVVTAVLFVAGGVISALGITNKPAAHSDVTAAAAAGCQDKPVPGASAHTGQMPTVP